MKEYFQGKTKQRSIKIYTGPAGADLFTESLDRQCGYERVYIGRKVLRILRTLRSPIRKSISGRFYKSLKINLENPK